MVKYGENKGILGVKSPSIRFINKKDKGKIFSMQGIAVESDINRLEYHGLDRCPDKGLDAFKRYCALGVLAANLHKLGNVLQEKARKQCEKSRKAA